MGLQLVAQGLRAVMDQSLGAGIDWRSGRYDEGDARSNEQNRGLRALFQKRQRAPREGQRCRRVNGDFTLDLLQRVGIGLEAKGQENTGIVDQEIKPAMPCLDI